MPQTVRGRGLVQHSTQLNSVFSKKAKPCAWQQISNKRPNGCINGHDLTRDPAASSQSALSELKKPRIIQPKKSAAPISRAALGILKSTLKRCEDSTKVTRHHCKPVAHNGLHSSYDCRDGNAWVPSRLVSELLTKKNSQGDLLTRRTNGWQPFQTCPIEKCTLRQSTQFKAPSPTQKAVATTSH